MNVQDRLRQELHERSRDLDVEGAGPAAVMAAADARLRRTRILGTVTAVVLVVGVSGVALALRDSDRSADEALVTETSGDQLPAPETATDGNADTQPESGTGASLDGGATEAGSDEVATTGVEPATDADEPPDEAPAASTDGDDSDDSAPAAQAPAATVPEAVDMVAHNGGFVALRTGSDLWFSTDGATWSPVADPRPGGSGVITDMTTHNSVLYATGSTGSARAGRPWLAASSGLEAWEAIDIPAPPDDGSTLTTVTTTINSVAAGAAGIIVTGETIVDLDIGQLLDADVIEAEAWTLGDSTGDLTKIVVYDIESGDPVDEIDLLGAGVPEQTLTMLAATDPTPFVAVGDGGSLSAVDLNLDPGTVLRNGFVNGEDFLASGFSRQFSGRILWSSPDGQNWQPIPVSVIGINDAEAIGGAGGNVVVFTGHGPLMTVQVRRAGQWNEVRLDELFGNRNDDYVLEDAVFGASGVAAAVATLDEAGNATFHVLTSPDGLSWQVATLESLAPARGEIVDVDSVAIRKSTVAVSYERGNGDHETIVVPTSLS